MQCLSFVNGGGNGQRRDSGRHSKPTHRLKGFCGFCLHCAGQQGQQPFILLLCGRTEANGRIGKARTAIFVQTVRLTLKTGGGLWDAADGLLHNAACGTADHMVRRGVSA